MVKPIRRVGVVLFQLGGPDTLEAIEPFLFNLFCDPDIIDFPFARIGRKPLAKLISTTRAKKVQHHYSTIGGGSPIRRFTEQQARAHKHNPFDVTKVWPKADYPLIEVGVMELNRYPDNFFAEVEQAAFSPANIVPGIGFSPDKMLQGRLFSYGDTQRYRLGVNFNHIPVNAPKCPFHSYHRDGAMRTDGNLGRTPTYFPNSLNEWIDQPDLNEPPLEIDGIGDHWDHRVDDDHYQQPGDLFRMMNVEQRQILFDNTARAVGGAAKHIQERHIANCLKADPAYGEGVARALGLELPLAAD